MEILNNAFKSTCSSVLGKEIGNLKEYEPYLLEMVPKPMVVNSSSSGKRIFLSRIYYSSNSNFVELENIPKNPPKININETKDVDSLINAVKENFSYCGNNNIGSSMNVIDSDSCQDGVNILNTHQVLTGKNVAYSHGIRMGGYVFGSVWSGEVSFIIRSQGVFFSKNCFESYLSNKSYNLYFSFNCRGCSETLFSFNQISKQYLIGNLQLQKEKYFELKSKLLEEISAELEKKKTFPSLFDFCSGD